MFPDYRSISCDYGVANYYSHTVHLTETMRKYISREVKTTNRFCKDLREHTIEIIDCHKKEMLIQTK